MLLLLLLLLVEKFCVISVSRLHKNTPTNRITFPNAVSDLRTSIPRRADVISSGTKSDLRVQGVGTLSFFSISWMIYPSNFLWVKLISEMLTAKLKSCGKPGFQLLSAVQEKENCLRLRALGHIRMLFVFVVVIVFFCFRLFFLFLFFVFVFVCLGGGGGVSSCTLSQLLNRLDNSKNLTLL